MEEAEHNSRIEKIAEMILSDNISLDEQEQNKLKTKLSILQEWHKLHSLLLLSVHQHQLMAT